MEHRTGNYILEKNKTLFGHKIKSKYQIPTTNISILGHSNFSPNFNYKFLFLQSIIYHMHISKHFWKVGASLYSNFPEGCSEFFLKELFLYQRK